jgi:hypothetical protein
MIIRAGDELAQLIGSPSCFQCEQPVSPPFAHWYGTDESGEVANLVFHPRCALHFGLRFLRDVHELDTDESLSFGGRGRA